MEAHVLVVGAGSIGERHLRCFQSTGRVHVSFIEINPELRETIAKRYNVPAYASLTAALADGKLLEQPCKAAVIATPANTHIEIARKLAGHDFHLLIEKPLSTNLEGIKELSAVLDSRGLVASVAYVYRSFPALTSMREALRSGRFGKPVQIVAVGGQHFPTYRPAYRSTYYTRHATGGGAIQDALTHVINAAEWLVGPIDRLVVDAAHQLLDGVEVEDTVHLLARHGNVLGSYCLNQHQAPNESSITVLCSQGTVRWQSHTQSWRWMVVPEEPWHDETFEPMPRDAAFIGQASAFLDAVKNGVPPRCSLNEAEQTLKVNLAALNSLQSQAWQTIR